MLCRPRLLHLHSTFDLGGKEARDVALINHWGDAFEHVIVSAQPGRLGALALIDRGLAVRVAHEAPPLAAGAHPGRLRALGRWIAAGGFDLVLGFNWGAMDGVAAALLCTRVPVIHHEDGFNQDELLAQKPARRWLRRLLLPRARAVLVPSATLERIARLTWGLAPPRLVRIANGIAAERFLAPPAADAIPGLTRRPGELVVGTLAGLRPVKALPRLVRAFAAATAPPGLPPARLVIVGQGPEEGAIRAEAARLGIADRLLLPGFLPHPERYVGLFDIFSLSSDSEQFPISLVEAMAAGLPAVATRVGDVAEILSAPNRAWLAEPADEAALAAALGAALADPDARARLGAANRDRVTRHYSREAMFAAYARVYGQALGARSPFPPPG